jgi:glycerate-2-kinase
MNCVRKHLSAVKGGRLASLTRRASSVFSSRGFPHDS